MPLDGDHYPHNPVEGAIMALKERDDIHIILLGPEKTCFSDEIRKQGYSGSRLTVVNAPEIIGMDESPATAFKNQEALLHSYRPLPCMRRVSAMPLSVRETRVLFLVLLCLYSEKLMV